MTLISVFIIILKFLPISVANDAPRVTISNGKIDGETLQSVKGRNYYAYAGIPFAQPPIGPLRFEAPVPNGPWDGVLNTSTQNSKQCVQAFSPNNNQILGQEDCLYLNVYVPETSNYKPELLPVMFWIHGGGFTWGSGTFQDYGPQRFMDRNIILVSTNYRLAFTGLIAVPEDGFLGNNALHDLITALKWVQENIEAFGGNKSSVTIFGESAGAAFVNHLVLSPVANGLFHAAIIQSASALCKWATTSNPSILTKLLTAKLNCPNWPIESMKECIRNRTWQEIVDKGTHFQYFPGLPVVLPPCVDGKVIPDLPLKTMQTGNFTKIPIMIGGNEVEGAWFYSIMRSWFPRIGEEALKYDLPLMIGSFTYPQYPSEEFLEQVRKIYFAHVDVNNATAFYHTMSKIIGDLAFGCTDRAARYFANASDHPTYHYKLTYRGANSVTLNKPGEDLGVTHMDDIQYLFINSFFSGDKSRLNEDDSKMSDIMLNLWTNFASTHNPTPGEGEGGLRLSFTWEPYKDGQARCLQLNLNSTISEKCESENNDFWMADMQ